jgi:hypothetical protein
MWELKKSHASKVDVDVAKLMLSSSISCRLADLGRGRCFPTLRLIAEV